MRLLPSHQKLYRPNNPGIPITSAYNIALHHTFLHISISSCSSLVRQPFKYVKHNYQALKVTNSFGIFSPQWKICLYHGYEIPLHNNFQQPWLADLVPHPKWQLILLSVWQSFLAELILIFNVFKYNSSFYQQVGSGAKGLYKNLAELRLLVMLRARCFRSTTDNHKLECLKQNKPLTVSLAPL